MTLKLFGSVLIIVGCGGFGLLIAANYRREEKSLQALLEALEYMLSELRFHLPPLEQLCIGASKLSNGVVSQVLLSLSRELNAQVAPDGESCMRAALNATRDVPVLTGNMLRLLGKTLGKFDLEGQIKGLQNVADEVRKNIILLSTDRDNRLRSYRTLGFCAGISLAILLI